MQRSELGGFGRDGATAGAQPSRAVGDERWWKVSTAFDPASDRAQDVVRDIRRVPPPTGVTVLVGGRTAELVDVKKSIAGRVLVAAATLLAVTFAAFAVSSVSFLQMFGVGAAAAVLLDATVVRGLLLPAALALLGRTLDQDGSRHIDRVSCVKVFDSPSGRAGSAWAPVT